MWVQFDREKKQTKKTKRAFITEICGSHITVYEGKSGNTFRVNRNNIHGSTLVLGWHGTLHMNVNEKREHFFYPDR